MGNGEALKEASQAWKDDESMENAMNVPHDLLHGKTLL